jgi:uncharacterized protein
VTRVLIDTGPLVAFFNQRDSFHSWVRETLALIEPPLYTCEAVLTEAFFLLGRVHGARDALMTLLAHQLLLPDFRMLREIEALRTLMSKFDPIPMSLADACLVRMTELDPESVVLTLDSDFRIYRRHRRRAVPVLMPERR